MSSDPTRRLTRLYLLALGTIALTVLCGQALIQHSISRQRADSHLVNVAGSQRTLSQRLTKAALATRTAGDEPSRRRAFAEVDAVIRTWEANQRGLRQGDPSLGLPGRNSPEITELFTAIDPAFRKMVAAGHDLTVATTPDAEETAVRIIQAQENIFLDGMDQIVFRYENEATARVTNLQQIEIGMTLVILAILSAEGWFIFRPTVTRLKEKIHFLFEIQTELSATVTKLENARTAMLHREDQLRQAQKMETIGQFAGGIAHNFNNLLAVIMGYSGLMIQRLSEDDPSRKAVEHIHRATKRGSHLVQQLLSFSRTSDAQPVVLNVNDRIANLFSMLERLLGDAIVVRVDQEPTLWNIRIDPNQLEQVLLNLAANARDAMPTGGTLNIQTRNATNLPTTPIPPRRRYLAQSSENASLQPSSEYVLITVQDSGNGMPPSVLDRLFEPFFTTKPVDKGTGLGLASVLGVVTQAGGFIEVESIPDHGTIFLLYFPRERKAAGRYSITGTFKPMTLTVEEKPGTILVVEDEADVREMVREVLVTAGYSVVEATNGREALAVVDQMQEELSLVLSDMFMPEMGGHELYRRLAGKYPALKMMLMSGRFDGQDTSENIRVPTIEKPFQPGALLDRVKESLGN